MKTYIIAILFILNINLIACDKTYAELNAQAMSSIESAEGSLVVDQDPKAALVAMKNTLEILIHMYKNHDLTARQKESVLKAIPHCREMIAKLEKDFGNTL